MGGTALESVLHIAATHCHHIIVVPLLLSNCRCPIAVLELLPSSSSTSSPSAAAAASLLSLSPSPSLSHPSPSSPSLPSLSMLLRQRCFVIVVALCFLAANRRSWTKPLLPKLSTLVDCCFGWVAHHLQAFCMLLPPIAITSLSSHCCC